MNRTLKLPKFMGKKTCLRGKATPVIARTVGRACATAEVLARGLRGKAAPVIACTVAERESPRERHLSKEPSV